MRLHHVIVLGGGFAGMLAGAALSPHADKVTILERDELPNGPEPRRGVPQARHAHSLWSGGARAVEALLPGTHAQLSEAGARRIEFPGEMVALAAQRWMQRQLSPREYLITCSRELLDWTIRRQVLALPNVTVCRTVAERLLGDTSRVTGVHVSEHDSSMSADLVIDATGRGSRAQQWLSELGAHVAPEVVIDSGMTYASRLFRAPLSVEEAARFPLIYIRPNPRTPSGQGATLAPIENGRWLVTLTGTRGGEPTGDERDFIPFAGKGLHSIIGDLLVNAEPLGPVHRMRSLINRRRYYERLRTWPAGFLVLGDAVATVNPVYGQGMSVAALGALELHRRTTGSALSAGATRRLQCAIGRTIDTAWTVATGQDLLVPGAIGPHPSITTRLGRRYVDRLITAFNDRPAAATAVSGLMALAGPPTRAIAPPALLAALLGPKTEPLPGPTLTPAEWRAVDIAPQYEP